MKLTEALEIWESVVKGESTRFSWKFFNSVEQFGNSICCDSQERVSSVFVASRLCESKADFKRVKNSLFINELPVDSDGEIGWHTKNVVFCCDDLVLLRRGNKKVCIAKVFFKD